MKCPALFKKWVQQWVAISNVFKKPWNAHFMTLKMHNCWTFANSTCETLQSSHLTFKHRLVFNIFHPIFQNTALFRRPFKTQSNIYDDNYVEFSIPSWISWVVLSNSFRSSRREVFNKKYAKLCKTRRKTPVTKFLFDAVFSSYWNTKSKSKI